MSKNRQILTESATDFKLVVYHYPLWFAYISLVAIFAAFVVTSYESGFVLIDMVLIPSLGFLIYKVFNEKTTIEKTEHHLEITKQKVFDGDHKKFTLNGIKAVCFAEQTYSERNVLGTIMNYNILGPKKVYGQKVIGIKTGLTLYRFGQDFTEETIDEIHDFLKERLRR